MMPRLIEAGQSRRVPAPTRTAGSRTALLSPAHSLAAPMAVGRLVALPPVSACSAAPICPPPPIASYEPCSLANAWWA